MLVIAGAGTGKTTVIAERVAALLRGGHAAAGEILALTFTNEAAENIRLRVLQECSAPELEVSTFHSYCYNLLKRNHVAFDVLENEDLWIYLRRNIEKLPLDKYLKASDPAKFLQDFLAFFSRCHDELVDCHQYAGYVQGLRKEVQPELPRVAKNKQADQFSSEDVMSRCEEISRVYAAIEALLAQRNFVTFGGTIVKTVQLLRENPLVLEEERKRARYILIDEFQDCNTAQIELAGLLGGAAQNVFAVGDPDQAIYRFRGASSGAFVHFKQRFPRAQEVTLAENQRSTPAILEAAYTAIQKNPAALPSFAGGTTRQPLQSGRHSRHMSGYSGQPGDQSLQRSLNFSEFPNPAVNITVAGKAKQQAEHAADSILALREETGANWNEFAVLFRSRSHSEALIEALAGRGIPFDLAGTNLLETGILRDVLAVLSCLDSLGDNVSLFRVALLPQFGIDLGKLQVQMRGADRGMPLVKTLEESEAGKQLVAKIMIARARMKPEVRPVTAVLADVIREFGFDAGRAEIRALQKFAAKWEEKPLTRTRALREFIEYLGWFRQANGVLQMEKQTFGDAVRLLTIHAAKGLEFKHVYVVRVNSGTFPVNYRQQLLEFPPSLRHLSAENLAEFFDDKAQHHEEERRIFYVAVTRARDTLTIIAEPGKGKEKVPAGFVRDLVYDFAADPQRSSAIHLIHLAAAGPSQIATVPATWTATGNKTMPANGAAHANGNSHAAGSQPGPDLENGSAAAWLNVGPGVRNETLSAHAIEMYHRCPLQFKIARDWKIPSELSGALQYGSVMHGVLKDYFESVKQQRPHSLEKVLEIFKFQMEGAQFEDAYQRQLYEKQGNAELKVFIAAREQEPPPVVLQTEYSFQMDVNGSKVIGRFDRVDQGAGGRVRIVDYKTGSPKDQEKADQSVQFSVYALAAEKVWKAAPESLEFYNLEDNSRVATTRCDEDLRKIEEEIAEVAEGIRAEQFAPKLGFHCQWCSYRSLCPATEERLYGIQKATGEAVGNRT